MFKSKFFGKSLLAVFLVALFCVEVSGVADAKKTNKKRANSTSAAKKKTSTKKSSSSNSKRAASNSKRAASNSKRAASANARRASSTNARRAANVRRVASSAAAGTVGIGSVVKDDPDACPVGKVISFNVEEDKYYSAKNKACNAPANAHEEAWTASSGLKKLTWIDEADAYYFVCDDGFMEKNKACVDAYVVCPIGVPVEKNETGYINPNTEEVCTAPETSSVKKVTGTEAEEWGIDVGYTFSCKENYYAEEVKGTEGYLAKCTKCPSDKKSLAGSIGEESCKEAKFFCEEGSAFDETSQSCQACKEGEFSTGYGEECKTCKEEGVATCDVKTGKALTCNSPYELKDGKCTNVCKAGTALIGSECKACDAGTYSLDAATECMPCVGAATCDATTGKATSCKAGSKLEDGVCNVCPANTYSAGGTATSCTSCPDGYESASGAKECSMGAALVQLEKERKKYQNPTKTVNNTWTAGSGNLKIGVGCYQASALGAGGGATGSPIWIWKYFGQAGGNGGRADAWFCVNSGEATVTYSVGNGGSNACHGARAGNGGTTWFRVEGDLDTRFSGINSGSTVYAYGGTGGYSYSYNGTSKASNGSTSGLMLSILGLGRYLPNEYSYSKTGFGSSNNSLAKSQVGAGAAGGVHSSYYCGNSGSNGSFSIKTIKPAIPMY